MSVYVDDSKIPYRGMLVCNMFADTAKELHEAARDLQLGKWAYQRGETLAHYQVSLTKRREAIRRGAIPVDNKWVKERIRKEMDRMLNAGGSRSA